MSASRRRPWSELSSKYQRRLLRSGISEDTYASGASLSAARGHAATPERPERAERNPDRYRTYLRPRSPGMVVHTTAGLRVLEGLSKREKSRVGSHHNAIHNYLSGKAPQEITSQYRAKLPDFAGKTVSGYLRGSSALSTFELETREPYLDRSESRGEVRFEAIYDRKAA